MRKTINLKNALIIVTSFLMYFCLNNQSWATECFVLAWILLLMLRNISDLKQISLLALISGYFLFGYITLNSGYLRTDFNSPIRYVTKYMILFFVFTISRICIYLSSKEKKIFIKAAFISIIISCIVSIWYTIFVNSEAIRYREGIGITNTVSFDQAYGISIFIPLYIYYIWKNWRKLKFRPIYVLIIGVFVFFLYKSQLVTAMILSLVGLFLFYFIEVVLNKKNKMLRLMGASFVFLLIYFLIRIYLVDFLFNFAALMPNTVRMRIQFVIDTFFFTQHANSYNLGRRMEIANYSWNSFKAHPFFGVGLSGIKYGSIGYHQEWVDMLGVVGIVGTAVISVVVLRYVFRQYKLCTNTFDKNCYIVAILLFLILGFFDPCLTDPVLFTVFAIAPNLSAMAWSKSESHNNIMEKKSYA